MDRRTFVVTSLAVRKLSVDLGPDRGVTLAVRVGVHTELAHHYTEAGLTEQAILA